MPLKGEGGPGFHSSFALGLTSVAIAMHLCSSWVVTGPGEDRLGRIILLFCWTTLPYLVLAGLTWVIRSPAVLLVATALLAGTDLIALHDALVGHRSTSALGLAFQPALALLVFVPAATVVGVVLRIVPAWHRRRAKGGQKNSSD